MIKIPNDLPVPFSKTMEIIDSSKIQAFQDCPRGFFFSYVLGLKPDHPNVHLDFGSAWHEAMEVFLLENDYGPATQKKAYEAFLRVYREAFPDGITDNDRAPKNPEFAYKALQMYAKQYERDNFEVLYTETAGFVPISETRSMVVKLDSIVKDLNDMSINSMEHKTGSQNSRPWREKWEMMVQIKAYTHLLYSHFPFEDVGKIIVNGAIFTKTKVFEGIRVPVYQSPQQMAAFLWDVNHWIDLIEWNYRELAKVKPTDPVMSAFPINCASCSKFGCRMGGLCTSFPNPLRFVDEAPTGYRVEFWDPLRHNLLKADNVILPNEDGQLEIKPKSETEFKDVTLENELENKPKPEDFSAFLEP